MLHNCTPLTQPNLEHFRRTLHHLYLCRQAPLPLTFSKDTEKASKDGQLQPRISTSFEHETKLDVNVAIAPYGTVQVLKLLAGEKVSAGEGVSGEAEIGSLCGQDYAQRQRFSYLGASYTHAIPMH